MKFAIGVGDKGGVGKTYLCRGLAEAVPDARVFEMDSSPRMPELGGRVKFFTMRADRAAIEMSGGEAALGECDDLVNEAVKTVQPLIIDGGANCGANLLSVLRGVAPDLKAANISICVYAVTTAEPGSLAETARLCGLASTLGQCYLVENRLRGAVDPKLLAKIGAGATHIVLDRQIIDSEAASIVQGGGLASIPRLDQAALAKKFGFMRATRILADCRKFRYAAMETMRPIAEWLVS